MTLKGQTRDPSTQLFTYSAISRKRLEFHSPIQRPDDNRLFVNLLCGPTQVQYYQIQLHYSLDHCKSINVLSTCLNDVNAWLSCSRLRLNASKTRGVAGSDPVNCCTRWYL